ncbi:MAG TPA: enoyl-CoA hydratase/isomerase family protein [Gammaproteobacteria bacterium]|jgi:methylglutaconyl-CoA hydratase|nr:enoyl-CoA hydratase/isomerase family protein [Gammaproteobacteria bacterium]
MTEGILLLHTDSHGVATLTLNREEKHNAFDDVIVAELTAKLKQLDADPAVRVVVLTAVGKTFSAGGDLGWMRSMAKFSEKENLEDALKLADLMETLYGLSKPTIARVNGPAYGGGVGLVVCCDIAIATQSAKFALTEVRLGLVPSVISPYVIAAIGAHQARRYFLTAELIEAKQAYDMGLVHEVVTADILDETIGTLVTALLKAGPKALLAAKRLIAEQSGHDLHAVKKRTAELIAKLRVSPEGQEGLSAFLEKRPPNWNREK